MISNIKKIIFIFVVTLLITGCGNRQVFDTTRTFRCAFIRENDGTITKRTIDSWKDYDGEQLQIKFDNGETILISSFNVDLSTFSCDN